MQHVKVKYVKVKLMIWGPSEDPGGGDGEPIFEFVEDVGSCEAKGCEPLISRQKCGKAATALGRDKPREGG